MQQSLINASLFIWGQRNVDEFQALLDVSYDALDETVAVMSQNGQIDVLNICMHCDFCENQFLFKSYRQHRCQYDAKKQFIFDDAMQKHLWDDSPLKRMYSENQRQLQEILSEVPAIKRTETTIKTNKSHYVCDICKRMYVHASGLQRHLQSHNCDGQSTTRSALNTISTSRKSFESLLEIYRCAQCDRIFKNMPAVIEHCDAEHITNGDDDVNDANQMYDILSISSMLQCEFCDFVYFNESSLIRHEQSHTASTGYRCTHCEINSRSLKFMQNHRCNECPYQRYGGEHRINLQAIFICNKCHERFENLEKLYEHRYSAKHFLPLMNSTTFQTEYFCEKCGVLFVNIDELIEHSDSVHFKKAKPTTVSATDTGCRPYLCDICGKGYTQSSHLYQHLRFHKGIKPFECTKKGCNRRFTIRPDLNDHIRKCHTGERPYKCLDCDKTFLTGSVFYQHRLIHRGERRYGCRTCDKRFHRSDALKNHERIHSGDKPYPCGICSRAFRQKGDRDKHVRSRHSNAITLGSAIASTMAGGKKPKLVQSLMQIKPIFKNVDGVDVLTMIQE